MVPGFSIESEAAAPDLHFGEMELRACRHRGAFLDGDRVECRSDRLVFAEAGVVPMSVCARPCPYADLPLVPLRVPKVVEKPEYPCRHRGGVARTGTCDLCSLRGQPMTVFHCALHGECTLHRMHSRVKACAACGDRECGTAWPTAVDFPIKERVQSAKQ